MIINIQLAGINRGKMEQNNSNESQREEKTLSLGWYSDKLEKSIDKLYNRYSKDLDIGLNKRYYEQIESWKYAYQYDDLFSEVTQRIEKLLSADFFLFKQDNNFYARIGETLQACNRRLKSKGSNIQNSDVEGEIKCLGKELVRLLKENNENNEFALPKEILDITRYFTEIDNILFELKHSILLRNNDLLIVKGVAGVGKSHYFGHCARKCIDENRACILILGNHLINKDNGLEKQILDFLQLSIDIDNLLENLNSMGKTGNYRSIIFIDAVNEESEICKDQLGGLLRSIKRYSNIGTVISFRKGNDSPLMEDLIAELGASVLELEGFQYEDKAVSKFFEHYSIPLNRAQNYQYEVEFKNPLFLKLYCMANMMENNSHGVRGYIDIFDSYFKDLSEKKIKLAGIRKEDHIFRKAMKIIVETIFSTHFIQLDYEEISHKLKRLHPQLLGKLLDNNLFSVSNNGVMYFEYESLGDFIIARYLVKKYDIEGSKDSEQFNEKMLQISHDINSLHYSYHNIISLLMVIVPDLECRYDTDGGFEVCNWPEEITGHLEDFDVAYSFVRRIPERISKLSFSFFINNSNFLFFRTDMYQCIFDTILRLCITKRNYYNIEFLEREVVEWNNIFFNRYWTVYVSKNIKENHAFHDMIFLADKEYQFLDKEEKLLLQKTLAWCSVSLNWQARIICMQRLYSIFEAELDGLVSLIEFFEQFNYEIVGLIVENLYCIANSCACVCMDRASLGRLCDFIEQQDCTWEDWYYSITEYKDNILYLNGKEYAPVYGRSFAYKENVTEQEILLLRERLLKKDDFLYGCICADGNYYDENIDNFDEKCKVFFDLLQNSILCKDDFLVNNGDDLGVELKTRDFIDMIPEDEQINFCRNVFLEIADIGYNVILVEFWDSLVRDNQNVMTIFHNYEKMAFNIVLSKYINSGRIVLQNNNTENKFSISNLFYYEPEDISKSADNVLNKDIVFRKMYDIKRIKHQLRKEDYVNIGSVYDTKTSRRISCYIVDKKEKVDINKLEKLKNDILFEGINIAEIYTSRIFNIKMKQYTDKMFPAALTYCWDFGEWVEYDFCNPLLLKGLDYHISKDRFSCMIENQKVWYNKVFETQQNELLLQVDFLNNYLKNNSKKIVWVSTSNKENEEHADVFAYYGRGSLRELPFFNAEK